MPNLRTLLLLITAAAMSGCAQGESPAGGGSGSVTPTAITSAGDPNAPVPFLWAIEAQGRELLLQGGTLHAIPSRVRLIDPNGQELVSADTHPIAEGQPGLCQKGAGLTQASLQLDEAIMERMRGTWPAGYRIEARVGHDWRPVALNHAGCNP